MTATGHFLSGKKIVVAGAGIAGLTFVISLKKVWNSDLPFPEIVIYDNGTRQLDPASDRYTLSLNGFDKEGGMVAFRDMGILPELMEKSVDALPAEAAFHVWDNNWSSIIGLSAKPFEDLSVNLCKAQREDVREVLIQAAEKITTINWQQGVSSTEHLDGGKVRVHIAPVDGSESKIEDCDLLIAADGAKSKIREVLRPDDSIKYRDCVQFGAVSKLEDGLPTPLDKDFGMVITGTGMGSFFAAIDKKSLLWAVSRWEKGTPRDGYDKTDAAAFEAMKKDALELGKGMAEPFATIVANSQQDKSFIVPARDKEPFAHDEPTKNIVFIGDANHLISSFGGTGANLALKDGWDLAEAVVAATSGEQAIKAYDERSLPRSKKSFKDSHDRMNQSHYTGLKFTLLKTTLRAGSAVMSMAGK